MPLPYIQQRSRRIVIGALAFVLILGAVALGVAENYLLVGYIITYFIVGHFVIFKAGEHILRGQVFDEYSLMTLATLAAFIIGEYPEAITVMLFYELGEYLQHRAVHNAESKIRHLLDQRPRRTRVKVGNSFEMQPSEQVEIGATIQVHRGERLSHDGTLQSEYASLNTADITGESELRHFETGENLLSGYINEGPPIEVRVSEDFSDSTFSRMLQLTREAQSQKAPTELFFRKFAKIYTPVVALLAALIFIIPYFVVDDYEYRDWLYRAAVFLVISCPCALVLSIPLTYFAGIGAASRKGILIKGAQFIDHLARPSAMGFDKTGTLTRGQLNLSHISFSSLPSTELLTSIATAVELSHHPASQAIVKGLKIEQTPGSLSQVEEIPGMGIQGWGEQGQIRVGRPEWADPKQQAEKGPFTEVAVSANGDWVLSFYLLDTIKEDAAKTIDQLRSWDIFPFLLSGDRAGPVELIAEQLNISLAKSQVRPEEKLKAFQEISKDRKPAVFVGDGLNDSAVLAAADVGIAMGNTGSDLSIETSDVVIPGQQLIRLVDLIRISKGTKRILWQNITLVFLVKLAVLLLGGLGWASLWAAIAADVGVCLVAVANASRILYRPADNEPIHGEEA